MSPVLTITKQSYSQIDEAARKAAEAQRNSPSHKSPRYFTGKGTVQLAGRPAHITYQYDALGRSISYAQLDEQRGLARRIFDRFRGIQFDGTKRLSAGELKDLLQLEAEFDKERSRYAEQVFAKPDAKPADAAGTSGQARAAADSGQPLAGPSHGAWRSPITMRDQTIHTVLRTYAETADHWPRAVRLLQTPRIAEAAWTNPTTLRRLLEGCPDMDAVNALAASYPFFQPAADVPADQANALRTQAGLKAMLKEHTLARTVEKNVVVLLADPACANVRSSFDALAAKGIDTSLLHEMLRGPLQIVRMPRLLEALFDKAEKLDEAVQLAHALPWNAHWSLNRLLRHPGVSDKMVLDCHATIKEHGIDAVLPSLQRFLTGHLDPDEDSPMNRYARHIIWGNDEVRETLEKVTREPGAPTWLTRSHTDSGKREAMSEI